MTKKKILAAIIFSVTMIGFSACGTKATSKKITKAYCSCMDDAENLLDKTACLSTATSEYTKALNDVPPSELEEFKQGYQEGMKACK